MPNPKNTHPNQNSEREQIASWLEIQHCDRWKYDGPSCIKSLCLLFRDLAKRIRQGDFEQ